MEVILTKDVAGLGEAGTLVVVKPGYGRNYLQPQGLATIATKANKKVIEENLRQHAQKLQKIKQAAETIAKKINNINLVLSVKASESGKTFAAITPVQIIKAYESYGINIDAKQVLLKEIIKSTGNYQATIQLHKEIEIPVGITVKALEL
jgi:large subunit ribosomal protein L9